MKRLPVLIAILAASAIALGSAGTAAADQCGGGDQVGDQGGDKTCSPIESGPSADLGMNQGGQTGTDQQGATPTDQSGTAGETGQQGDQGAKSDGQKGTDQQAETQGNTGDKTEQTAEAGAAD